MHVLFLLLNPFLTFNKALKAWRCDYNVRTREAESKVYPGQTVRIEGGGGEETWSRGSEGVRHRVYWPILLPIMTQRCIALASDVLKTTAGAEASLKAPVPSRPRPPQGVGKSPEEPLTIVLIWADVQEPSCTTQCWDMEQT